MRRSRVLRLCAAASLATFVTCGSIATVAASTPEGSALTKHQEIKLFAVETGSGLIEEAPAEDKPDPGDVVFFADKLSDYDDSGHDEEPKTDEKSKDGGECRIVSAEQSDPQNDSTHSYTMQCNATLWLKGGQISAQGLVKKPGNEYEIAITGGTGDYDKARGTLQVQVTKEAQGDQPQETKLTVNLS
jgi:hypothetical protein